MSRLLPNDNRVRRQRLGAAALMAIGVVFIWRSFADLPLGTIDNPGPAAMPLLIAALLVLFAVWNLTGLVDPGDDPAEPGGAGHAVRVIAAIVVAALALGPLGYRLTILGLLVFFLGVVERKPVITVLAVSLALSFGSHALLHYVLKVPLPAGPWGL
jgi:tripartite tricarboxylate transporter TctB family protein